MIEAACHCGAVRLCIAVAPETVTDCNCSICRKLGVLWAYYRTGEVEIVGLDRTSTYVRDDGPDHGDLAFHHCRTCGCATHWSGLKREPGRMGVNARLMEPAVVGGARVRRLDGADTWTSFEETWSPHGTRAIQSRFIGKGY